MHELWTDEETARFETVAAGDRLYPVLMLQMLGLRPEEACGLRWKRDTRLRAGELAVTMARTPVDGNPVEKPPKTIAGCRTLPLDDALTAALKAFHALQSAEKLAAGDAYEDRGTWPATSSAARWTRPACAASGTAYAAGRGAEDQAL